jgi:hypothetical protein
LLPLFNRDGIFLSHSIGVKSYLHLFLWGGAYSIGIKTFSIFCFPGVFRFPLYFAPFL